jgi:hypothetical protein
MQARVHFAGTGTPGAVYLDAATTVRESDDLDAVVVERPTADRTILRRGRE